MRLWKFIGKDPQTGESKSGSVEAPDRESVMGKLNNILNDVEIEDEGPIFYYVLSGDRDSFQKATSEVHGQAEAAGEPNLMGYPSDEGRKWKLYLPNATPQLLYNVHQLITGETDSDDGPEVTVIGIPAGMAGPMGMNPMMMNQIMQMGAGQRRGPRGRSNDEMYNKLDTRELMAIFQLHQSMILQWLNILSRSTSPYGGELLKEFKLMTREYRRIVDDAMQLIVTNLSANLPNVEFVYPDQKEPTKVSGEAKKSNGEDNLSGVPSNP